MRLTDFGIASFLQFKSNSAIADNSCLLAVLNIAIVTALFVTGLHKTFNKFILSVTNGDTREFILIVNGKCCILSVYIHYGRRTNVLSDGRNELNFTGKSLSTKSMTM